MNNQIKKMIPWVKGGRKYKLRKAFALCAEKMLKEHDIKEFSGEAGDVSRALLKSKTVIAGRTPVNSVCVLEKHERYGNSKQEDRMRANERQ